MVTCSPRHQVAVVLEKWLRALHPDLRTIVRKRDTLDLPRTFETSKSIPSEQHTFIKATPPNPSQIVHHLSTKLANK